MEIRIMLHTDMETAQPFIRIDFYRTPEAITDPENNWKDAFTITKPLNVDLDNRDCSIQKMLNLLENSVNALLEAAENK